VHPAVDGQHHASGGAGERAIICGLTLDEYWEKRTLEGPFGMRRCTTA